ncbi:MAG TPA: hypothetical protein VJP85_01625 [Candidatus Baltobacteraceae bacterium]|nr:hypothetical protein [Candidatus Baltobacteraceae bacterium]
MAISAVMFFKSDGDIRAIYDAVIDEMGVRDNPARGGIYHWCAPVPGGMQVCDVWETSEAFDAFAQEKIAPITARHGLGAPELDVQPVHEMIVGRSMSHTGTGVLFEFDGDTDALLAGIDSINERMNAIASPPEGLVFHCSTARSGGVRVIDHWRSREDFERFVETQLKPALANVAMPQPRMTFFDVYNTIDKRVAAHV